MGEKDIFIRSSNNFLLIFLKNIHYNVRNNMLQDEDD